MSIFESPMIQKMFMGKAKELIAKNHLKAITIIPDANGELQFQLYKEEIVVVNKQEFDDMIKNITNG